MEVWQWTGDGPGSTLSSLSWSIDCGSWLTEESTTPGSGFSLGLSLLPLTEVKQYLLMFTFTSACCYQLYYLLCFNAWHPALEFYFPRCLRLYMPPKMVISSPLWISQLKLWPGKSLFLFKLKRKKLSQLCQKPLNHCRFWIRAIGSYHYIYKKFLKPFCYNLFKLTGSSSSWREWCL